MLMTRQLVSLMSFVSFGCEHFVRRVFVDIGLGHMIGSAGGDHHRDLFGAELDFTLAFQRFHVDDRIADLGVFRDVIGLSV